jgi:hypothetical protein
LGDEEGTLGELSSWANGLREWGIECVLIADTAMKNYVLPYIRFMHPEDAEHLYGRLQTTVNWLRGARGQRQEPTEPRIADLTASWAQLHGASAGELRHAAEHAIIRWHLAAAKEPWLTMNLDAKVPGLRFVRPILDRIGVGRNRRSGPTL